MLLYLIPGISFSARIPCYFILFWLLLYWNFTCNSGRDNNSSQTCSMFCIFSASVSGTIPGELGGWVWLAEMKTGSLSIWSGTSDWNAAGEAWSVEQTNVYLESSKAKICFCCYHFCRINRHFLTKVFTVHNGIIWKYSHERSFHIKDRNRKKYELNDEGLIFTRQGVWVCTSK